MSTTTQRKVPLKKKSVYLYFYDIWQHHFLRISFHFSNFSMYFTQSSMWVRLPVNLPLVFSFLAAGCCLMWPVVLNTRVTISRQIAPVLLWQQHSLVVWYHTACSDFIRSRITWMVRSPTAHVEKEQIGFNREIYLKTVPHIVNIHVNYFIC